MFLTEEITGGTLVMVQLQKHMASYLRRNILCLWLQKRVEGLGEGGVAVKGTIMV